MSAFRYLLSKPMLWVALGVLLSAELLLRQGWHYPLLQPESYAGTTARMQRAIALHGPERIEFVSLGSSIAEYGIDHQLVAEHAAKVGVDHVNLSSPGNSLMSLRAWSRWLPEHFPRLKGGLIVVGPDDYHTFGNGSYELGSVAPLNLGWKTAIEHVPLDRNLPESFGSISQLLLYRNDFRQLLAHPFERMRSVLWWRFEQKRQDRLAFSVSEPNAETLCGMDLSTPAACLSSAKPTQMSDALYQQLRNDCQRLQANQAQQVDLPALAARSARVQAVRLEVLQQLNWRGRTLIVQIPMHPLQSQSEAATAEALRQALYAKASEQGLVKVLNLAPLLAAHGPSCGLYRDLWHLNQQGRRVVTQALLPELTALYQAAD